MAAPVASALPLTSVPPVMPLPTPAINAPLAPAAPAIPPQLAFGPSEPLISSSRGIMPPAPKLPPQALERDVHDFSPVVSTTPEPVSFESSSTKNISSDEIVRSEVDKIADELRSQLKDKLNPEPATAPLTALATPAVPVRPTSPEGDTILIDHDGNMIQSAEADLT